MRQNAKINGRVATPQKLREQVEHTRGELGQSVAALAARLDIRSRARQQAGTVREQVGGRASQVRHTTAQAAHRVRHPRNGSANGTAVGRVGKVRDTARNTARNTAKKATEGRGRRLPMVAVVGVVTTLVVVRRVRHARGRQ